MQEIFPSDWIGKPEADKIELLKASAKELIEAHVSVAEALPQLRERAELIHSSCRNQELTQFLRNVKSKKVTIDDLIKPGDKLKLTSEPFILNGVIISGGTNLIIGREKKGKTAWVIATIAAWHRGDDQFCGFDFVGPCPPVAIIGPDMSETQWAKMLHMYGLADEEGEVYPDSPIQYLLHMGHGLSLNSDGLNLIEELADDLCQRFPDQQPLLVFDSYARLVDDLGLQEATSEFAGPLSMAQALLRQFKVTDIWLHHSAANRDTGKATSRGSTALPALADQQIFMEYPTANEDDNRTMLRTKGRDIPVRALIERTQPDGVWIVHANGEEVEQQNRIQQRIDKINAGSIAQACFFALFVLHLDNPDGVAIHQIANHLHRTEDTLRKPLNRLKELNLICEYSSRETGTKGGRPRLVFKFLSSVQKLLRANPPCPITPSALGNAETTPTSPETPDSAGSQPALARMEKSLKLQKLEPDRFLGVSGLSRRVEGLPPLNGSKDAVHAFIRANPEPHHSTLANQIKARLDIDITGADVKAIRQQLDSADDPVL